LQKAINHKCLGATFNQIFGNRDG